MTKSRDPGGQVPHISTDISVEVENMGGIRSAALSVSPGVTILVGQNATNRTSLLRAIAGALGGSEGVIKRDAEMGSVSLTLDGTQYTREYDRTDGSVRSRGEPYSEDESLVDLFVCLLNNNPIRRAVRTEGDLAELLLAPVDTDELDEEISKLQSERAKIDEQLGEIRRESKRLPKLEEKRTKLEGELEEIESELKTLQERTEPADAEWTDLERAESILEDLEETQSELERTESEIDVQRDIKGDLGSDLESVRKELSQLEVHETELSELEAKLERLQGRESEISVTIDELSTIVEQNRRILTGEGNVISELAVDGDTVSRLDPGSRSIECWTCGNQIQKAELTDRLGNVDRIVEKKRTERREIRERISEIRTERDSIQEDRERCEELTERKENLRRDLKRRSEMIDELIDKEEQLREEVADRRAELESVGDTGSDALADYERMNKLEYERGQIEREVSDLSDEINEIEYLRGKRGDHEARREDVTERISSLRSKVETLEKEAVDTFNTHMSKVLDRLGYQNIERVWLERRSADNRTSFALHIVREDDDGIVYEDSVDHLSESEREVIGLVVAMAGYLTHDVRQSIPVMLLDSLEAIDAERIADLVDYFENHTDFLLLALLEEDAEVLPDTHNRVSAPDGFAET